MWHVIDQNSFFHKFWLESCSDGRKNQNETGTDCGGPCSECGKLKCA